jgi:hypothetical protein
MNRFSLFRRRGLKPPGYRMDKPTKGAGRQTVVYILFAVMGLLLIALPIRAQNEATVLYAGVHQAEDAAIERPGFSWVVVSDGAQSGEAIEADVIQFTAYGTDVWIRVRRGIALSTPEDNPDYTAILTSALETDAYTELCDSFSGNCAPSTFVAAGEDGWVNMHIAHSAQAEQHSFRLATLLTNVQLDSITVLDRSFQNQFPNAATVGITLGMTVFVVIAALLERQKR